MKVLSDAWLLGEAVGTLTLAAYVAGLHSPVPRPIFSVESMGAAVQHECFWLWASRPTAAHHHIRANIHQSPKIPCEKSARTQTGTYGLGMAPTSSPPRASTSDSQRIKGIQTNSGTTLTRREALSHIRQAAREHGGKLSEPDFNAWCEKHGVSESPYVHLTVLSKGQSRRVRWSETLLALNDKSITPRWAARHTTPSLRADTLNELLTAIRRVANTLGCTPTEREYERAKLPGEPHSYQARILISDGGWPEAIYLALKRRPRRRSRR